MTSIAALAIAGGGLDALLTKDPIAEAEKAYAAGDRRHIVVPVCGKDSGEVIPGWPLEDSPRVRTAMDLGKRPVSCADLGEDPKRHNFIRVAQFAEKYNRKLLELEAKGKR